jgi:hypothetical protein
MLDGMSGSTAQALATLRRLLLFLVAFGVVGLSVELVLLEHFEDPVMFVPFAALGVALAAVALDAATATTTTAWVLRVAMAQLIASGVAGIALHYQGSREFQLEMDPAMARWDLFWKVMHMKAPPTLAPGAMVQLGLLGLASTYRHPAFDPRATAFPTGEPS